eukprot:TRINITY_DN26215_c0_g1_i1.p1 TRINITY_DN26215_c0_g1~~TRINITY_DN26215_c0_g1_i1.p1  ORF type:complete len:189 (+),score=58.19 TRINITY_DN26215_c0_g1_i1:32-568(+)
MLEAAPLPPTLEPSRQREKLGYVLRWRGRIAKWKEQWLELKGGYLKFYVHQNGTLRQALRVAFCQFSDIEAASKRYHLPHIVITPGGQRLSPILMSVADLWELTEWQEALIRAQQHYFQEHLAKLAAHAEREHGGSAPEATEADVRRGLRSSRLLSNMLGGGSDRMPCALCGSTSACS